MPRSFKEPCQFLALKNLTFFRALFFTHPSSIPSSEEALEHLRIGRLFKRKCCIHRQTPLTCSAACKRDAVSAAGASLATGGSHGFGGTGPRFLRPFEASWPGGCRIPNRGRSGTCWFTFPSTPWYSLSPSSRWCNPLTTPPAADCNGLSPRSSSPTRASWICFSILWKGPGECKSSAQLTWRCTVSRCPWTGNCFPPPGPRPGPPAGTGIPKP